MAALWNCSTNTSDIITLSYTKLSEVNFILLCIWQYVHEDQTELNQVF